MSILSPQILHRGTKTPKSCTTTSRMNHPRSRQNKEFKELKKRKKYFGGMRHLKQYSQ